MFAVGWGARAGERLVRIATIANACGEAEALPAETTSGSLDRIGALAVMDAPGADAGSWRCWISGRLTNAPELCERLGLSPATGTAALIAQAYARLGPDACELLRGTFVLVACDRERGVVTVLRDHLGGRPLVYAPMDGGAVLAEHERAILDLLPRAPAPDRLALAQWIERGGVPHKRTLFEGIERIPPAHRVVLSADAIAVEPYWRPRYQDVAAGSRLEVAERLRAAAFAAVERAAEGASRPALRLSGGLDSACVAAGLAAREDPRGEAVAFGAVFPSHPETDERGLIEATARHTGLPVELIAFDDRASILAPALEHILRWRVPPASPNLFAWRGLMARARELGVDAMLDGEGGDELFGFAPHLIADRLRAGRALSAWRLTGQIPEVGADADLRMRLRALRVYGVSRLLPPAVKRRRERRRGVVLAPGSLLAPADALALSELEDDRYARELDGPLWWRGLAGGLTRPGETLGVSAHLRREAIDERIDRRHPFLFDLDLLLTALADPPELQFEVRDRALLRDGLTGHIPEAVRTRHEKSFFTGLLPAGLAADGALLAEGPAQAGAPVREFVRADALQALLEKAPSSANGPSTGEARAARRLWHVGLADVWLRALERPRYPLELLSRARSRMRQPGAGVP